MIGQPGAIWIPSPYHANFTWPYDGGRPKWIIIHGTASGTGYTAQDTGHDFQHSGNSVHYIVGYDGTVVQCVDESVPAWGNGVITGPAGVAPIGGNNGAAGGNSASWPHDAYWDTAGHHDPNGCTISIEHAKDGPYNQSQLSDVQMRASFALVAAIVARWGIPRQYGNAQGGITGHYSIDPVNRANCPGPYPFQQLINYIGGSGYLPGGVIDLGGQAGQPVQLATYTPVSEQVHKTLINTPGFYGIALALDEAEQFPGWVDLTTPTTISTPAVNTPDVPVIGSINIIPSQSLNVPDIAGIARSIGATISDNFVPFAIRSGIVAIGLALMTALTVKALEPVIKDVVELL